ncbi:MAG: hypothetical protein ACI4QT_04020 [Kiritimatiellia bacterium]
MTISKILAFGLSIALAATGLGGVVCQWNNEVARGDWSDAANWTDGVVPGPEDAASFNLAIGEAVTVDFPDTLGELSVTNLWIKGGGSVTFQMPESVSMVVTATSANANTLGGGRDAMAIRGGSTFILTGGGTISNLESQANQPYNQLQMSEVNSRLFVTGGSKFKFAARIPVNGIANVNASTTQAHKDTEIHVDGEGSVATFYANFAGIGTRIYAENGGTFNGAAFSLKDLCPPDFGIVATNNAHLNLTVTGGTLLSGNPGTYLIDDSSTAVIDATEFISLADGSSFTISGGSTLSAKKLSPGYKACQNLTVLVTNATAEATQYLRIGASQAGTQNNLGKTETYGSTNTTLRIAAGGKLNLAASVANPLTIGWTSTADTLFVDGGEFTSLTTQKMIVGYTNCVDATLKIRGETATMDLAGGLDFQLGGETYPAVGTTLACELPLNRTRAAIVANGAVTIAPGTKLKISVPEDAFGVYTLLEAPSIEGTFAAADIEVEGRLKVDVLQDGNSVVLRANSHGSQIILR